MSDFDCLSVYEGDKTTTRINRKQQKAVWTIIGHRRKQQQSETDKQRTTEY